MATIDVPSFSFEKIFQTLNTMLFKQDYSVKDADPEVTKKLYNLNEELGLLSNIIEQKNMILGLALAGPVGFMVGGAPIGGIEELKGLEYVASDRPSKRVFSTARILANILKKYENELTSNISKSILQDLENKLISVYNNEIELFRIIAQMDELQTHLEMGNIADNEVGLLKDLVKNARTKNDQVQKERKATLEKITTELRPWVAIMNAHQKSQ